MRVLADRHHAGLWASLDLLGQQLGWELFTPVGFDWFESGIWQFGHEHFGRELADQYLTADAKWTRPEGEPRSVVEWQRLNAGAYVSYDPEYPDRAIRGVTLARARAMDWDLVIATVQDNQQGFARLASEIDAKYVYQVGNTRQQIDWSLDPLALVSSEAEILGRGVRYHQAMHPSYAWREPTERQRITSFVNLMPRIDCWPLLTETWKGLNDFSWRIHGSECPDGVVQPTTAIAQAMGASGFGWHDKPTGDGFGHVLWGWAAVGRPIIGHASHYRGQLGEILWRDGETCIDLDKHPEPSALIREIAADPERHAAMCRAMRETFEQHYDTGTERIRALLA